MSNLLNTSLFCPVPIVPVLEQSSESFTFWKSLSCSNKKGMALKAVHVSDVPNLDQVPENGAALALCSSRLTKYANDEGTGFRFPKKFVVMGHRGMGMNILQSSDRRLKRIKENSLRSFNSATKFPVDFVEFDVQVTKDGCPIIFHDIFIITDDKGVLVEKRVTELTLAEFLSYGLQTEPGNVEKPLFRKTKDGRIFEWKVEEDDPLCTLQDVFLRVGDTVGFNIELKFDDHKVYSEEELTHVLGNILQVVFEHAKDRPIMFSSFQPDAAQLMRKLQITYPVFFLTNGGSEIYTDTRRNSLDEAIKVCVEGGLQGIVSEVKAIFRYPEAVTRIRDSKLSLVAYGQLNNVPEVVFSQYLMGVEGVIVDLVSEITEAVSGFSNPAEGEKLSMFWEEAKMKTNPQFSADELSILLKLIPELICNKNEPHKLQ